jgi:hypothetical protein
VPVLKSVLWVDEAIEGFYPGVQVLERLVVFFNFSEEV